MKWEEEHLGASSNRAEGEKSRIIMNGRQDIKDHLPESQPGVAISKVVPSYRRLTQREWAKREC